MSTEITFQQILRKVLFQLSKIDKEQHTMAKKRTLFNIHLSEDQKIVRDITDFLKNEYKQYAKYVIATRAIPSIVDGFKVGARKIMWSALTGGAKNGKEIKITKPIDAMKNGIAYLPEDRKVDGIVGDLSVRDNIILAAQVLRGFFRPFSKAQANKFADEYIKLLEIKTASADTPIKSLSGGNQQKVILARWLLTHPEYLILDEPTRGIDIGTKIEIQKLVLKLASEGMSVTFISSETDEMLRTCSRLIVMRDRRKVGEISGEDLTQSKIMDTIAGGEKKNG